MTHLLKPAAQALVFLTLMALSFSATAQDGTIQKLYGQAGTGPATRNGYLYEMGLTTVWKSKWTTTLSYYRAGVNPKSLPKDYDPGYTIILIIPIPNFMPEAELSQYALSVGRYIESGRNVWFTTEAGVSLVQGQTFTFTRGSTNENSIFYQAPNYKYTTRDNNSVGVLLKADATWAFSSFAGLGAGVVANINSIQSSLGMELKVVLGWMNRTPKKAKNS